MTTGAQRQDDDRDQRHGSPGTILLYALMAALTVLTGGTLIAAYVGMLR